MSRNLSRLIEIMARLRDPERGCPWDVAQSFASIAPYTIEEAYEVADAIERNDMAGLRDELGDLLLQVVFHARMAEEDGQFDFDAVAGAIADKLVRRHPHVFAGAPRSDGGSHETWERQKAEERAAKAAARGVGARVLDDVPHALPALTRAAKLQQRAARVGFDWGQARPVLDKIAEEIGELRAEMDAAGAHQPKCTEDGHAQDGRVEEELGDLFFALVNLARHVGADPEAALRRANAKFERRFAHIEDGLAERGRTPGEATLDEMEALWRAAKRAERRDA